VTALLALSLASALAPDLARYEFAQIHMGTEARIALYAADAAKAGDAAERAFARVAALDAALSDYRETSELTALCRRAGAGPQAVGDDLFRVLARAQELARLSRGAFDPTVGPLSLLWRHARRKDTLPRPEAIERARALVGHEKIALDPSARTVSLARAGMKLDLGGIAKGFAADAALEALASMGVDRALVAIGGDMVASGPPPGSPGWRIAIAAPPGVAVPQAVTLSRAAVSTSGDAEQHLTVGRTRYSHVIDPRTGQGVRGQMQVTVVAGDGATADGLATAACVLGLEDGIRLVESVPGAAALMMAPSPEGPRAITSQGWKAARRDGAARGRSPR
jgi:thiamine biosynthesis lipoprotein